MDDLLQLAALLTTLCAPPDMSRSAPFATAGVATAMNATVLHATPSMLCARHSIVPATPSAVVATRSTRFISATELQADSWTGEDKFRHAAASWAAMVFTYAAARAVHDDSDTALAVAVPVTLKIRTGFDRHHRNALAGPERGRVRAEGQVTGKVQRDRHRPARRRRRISEPRRLRLD